MTQYRVTPIWWPDGWEPNGPLDIPKCVARAHEPSAAEPVMAYDQALATVRALNRQNMDRPGATWCVMTAAGGEAEAAGELQVVRPEKDSSGGDCSNCPASHFPCAAEN